MTGLCRIVNKTDMAIQKRTALTMARFVLLPNNAMQIGPFCSAFDKLLRFGKRVKRYKIEYQLKGGDKMKPLVGVIMGSTSDWETMKNACDILEELDIPYEKQVVSAHRTPDLMFEYATEARGKGLKSHHCRCWRRSTFTGDGRSKNDTAGHWCARTIKSTKWTRFLIIHRSNARRCTRCDSSDW